MTFLLVLFVVLVTTVAGVVMERRMPTVGSFWLPETPPEVVAWREAQDRRAERRSS